VADKAEPGAFLASERVLSTVLLYEAIVLDCIQVHWNVEGPIRCPGWVVAGIYDVGDRYLAALMLLTLPQ
jgi:hypothetical protein